MFCTRFIQAKKTICLIVAILMIATVLSQSVILVDAASIVLQINTFDNGTIGSRLIPHDNRGSTVSGWALSTSTSLTYQPTYANTSKTNSYTNDKMITMSLNEKVSYIDQKLLYNNSAMMDKLTNTKTYVSFDIQPGVADSTNVGSQNIVLKGASGNGIEYQFDGPNGKIVRNVEGTTTVWSYVTGLNFKQSNANRPWLRFELIIDSSNNKLYTTITNLTTGIALKTNDECALVTPAPAYYLFSIGNKNNNDGITANVNFDNFTFLPYSQAFPVGTINENFNNGTVDAPLFTSSSVNTSANGFEGWYFSNANRIVSRPVYKERVGSYAGDKYAYINLPDSYYNEPALRFCNKANAADYATKVYFACDLQPVVNTDSGAASFMQLHLGGTDDKGIFPISFAGNGTLQVNSVTVNQQGEDFRFAAYWYRYEVTLDVANKKATYTLKNLTTNKTYAENTVINNYTTDTIANLATLTINYRNRNTNNPQYLGLDNVIFSPYGIVFPMTQSNVTILDKNDNVLLDNGAAIHYNDSINPVNVGIKLNNNSNQPIPIKYFAAAYDANNKLVNIKVSDATTLQANTSDQSIKVMELDISKAAYIKLSCFNNFNSITPYLETTKIDVLQQQDITKNYMTNNNGEDVTLKTIEQFKNKNVPTINYWYWKTTDLSNPNKNLDGVDLFYTNKGTVPSTRYLDDLNKYIDVGAFDITMASNQWPYRGPLEFYNYDQCTEWFKKSAELAHSKGSKFGFHLFDPIPSNNIDKSKSQAYAHDYDVLLDASGKMSLTSEVAPQEYVNQGSVSSDLLKAVAFKKTSEGFYDPATLQDVTAQMIITEKQKNKIAMTLDLGSAYKDYTVHVITAHYYMYVDLFNKDMRYEYIKPLKEYHDRGVEFDAVGLDEVGWMALNFAFNPSSPYYNNFKWRIYSDGFAEYYKTKTGKTLADELFKMKYAPNGDDSEKIRAINQYWENVVLAPRMLEEEFYDKAKELYGEDCYIGVHNTRHNDLLGDEIYRTSNQWWQIKRDYAFTDEYMAFPIRLGIMATKPNPITYDMKFGADAKINNDVNKYYGFAITELPYNSRIFNLAYNDTLHGFDFETADGGKFLGKMALIGRRMGLLDEFKAPLPKADLLFVYGSPALTNWYPNITNKNRYNLNSLVNAQQISDTAFKAGYVNALIPSSEIDEGKVSVNADGSIKYGNATYKAMVFIQPEYAKQSTIDFINTFNQRDGKFLIDGDITKDFYGKAIDSGFKALLTANKCSTSNTSEFLGKLSTVLGMEKSNYPNGCVMTDGSVQLSDVQSMFSDKGTEFKITIGQYTYTGTYNGVVALKANESTGEIEKLACGGFTSIKVNGVEAFAIKEKADILMIKQPDGKYELTISESKCEHLVSPFPLTQ